MFGGIELQQQHDENAVVWKLLEFCLTNIMVLDQDPNDDPQYLKAECRTVSKIEIAKCMQQCLLLAI